MTHEPDEVLSAYLDGEVDADERDRIEAHLAECPECSTRRDGMRAAGAALASLPEVTPTSDETRALRQALADRRPRRGWLGSPGWAVAGAVALVLVASVFLISRAGSNKPGTVTAERQSKAGKPLSSTALGSDKEVADLVASDPEVKAKAGKYRVADVGTGQEQALATFDQATVAQPAAAPKAAEAERAGAGDSTASPEQGAASAGQAAKPLGFCLRAKLQSQPYPMMPLSGRPIQYKGQDAWLLVYAYTTSKTEQAKLDRLQVWVVKRVDCQKEESVLLVQFGGPSPSPSPR